MHVDFGLFKGDELLHRGLLKISTQEDIGVFGDLRIRHHLLDEDAEILVELFSDGERLIKSNLTMPIHESEDWESIELGQFTLAFKCSLDS